jgi:hypothetical protein
MPRGRQPRSEPARPPVPRVRAIIELLGRHRVNYVVIGGIAVRLWGSPLLTDDVDICPATDAANLKRLAAALNELEAQFRAPGLEHEAPTPSWDGRAFRAYLGGSVALTSKLGWLDIWFRPDGTDGYAGLIEHSTNVEVAGTRVKLASLDDIIRSKEASGRLKDLERLSHLRDLRRQIERT